MNPGLDGSGTFSSVAGWTAVPYTAPYSDANTGGGATPDLLSLTGPNLPFGMYGTPHSGDTFVAGVYATGVAGSNTLHEGIEQTVSGFTVGQEYSFSFYQANARYLNFQDDAGSWSVFANGVLVGITVPTTSTIAWNTPDKPLNWEQRTVNFTASAETLTLSFLSYDPDGNSTTTQGVAMGIDTFSEITAVPEPSVAAMGVIAALGLLRRRR